MVLAVWSPKGGVGTSVIAAGLAVVLSRSHAVTGARLADLAGDQPSIFGVASDPPTGLADWLAAGVEAPTEALDRLAVPVRPRLVVLPRGGSPGALPGEGAAGAALAVALDGVPTIIDAGVPRDPAARGVVAAADISVVVVRPCYLALRRAVGDDLLRTAAGVIVIEEVGRALTHRDVGNVLGRRVLARVPMRVSIAKSVDAGLFGGRLPRDLTAAMRRVLEHVGFVPGIEEGAAA
jgi:CO dehydrogenase nickel-insertion accessory protein CooC1